jgi:hypothetical protein
VGNVNPIEGTPVPFVTNTPLLPVIMDDKVFAEDVYNNVLTPPKVVTPVPPLNTGKVLVTFVPDKLIELAVKACPVSER